METAAIASITNMHVQGVAFPSVVTPPASFMPLFLAGAGVRGLYIDGDFVAFSAIGIYLEDSAVPLLAAKWKGKDVDELVASLEFFRDIFSGPFDKFTKVTLVRLLTGQQYSDKVAENCAAQWKAAGVYTEAEAAILEEFKQAFKADTFPPGSCVLFTHASVSLTITFSKEGGEEERIADVIESKALSEAILESIIGENGVSPAAKRSLAMRLSGILKEVSTSEEAKEAKLMDTLLKLVKVLLPPRPAANSGIRAKVEGDL